MTVALEVGVVHRSRWRVVGLLAAVALLCAGAVVVSRRSSSRTSRVGASVGDAGLAAVQMVSPATVFAGGPGRIIRSDDGGHTWAEQEIACAQCVGVPQVTDIDMLSTTEGWAATSSGLFKTTDGVQWTEEPTGQDNPPATVDFVSTQDGWIVAGLSVARTSDGGATWTALAGLPGDAESACFSAVDDGWLTTRTAVFHSTDGGTTWTLVLDQAPAQPDRLMIMLQCTTPGAAWVEISEGGTMPGARTWTLIHFADGGEGTMPVAAGGPAGASAAGGTAPSPYAVIDQFKAYLIEYSPSEVSLNGILVSSIGESFQRNAITTNVVNGVSFIPAAVSFADEEHGVLVGIADGDRPPIYSTSDGGATWNPATVTPRR